jgi:hypothetical protein
VHNVHSEVQIVQGLLYACAVPSFLTFIDKFFNYQKIKKYIFLNICLMGDALYFSIDTHKNDENYWTKFYFKLIFTNTVYKLPSVLEAFNSQIF